MYNRRYNRCCCQKTSGSSESRSRFLPCVLTGRCQNLRTGIQGVPPGNRRRRYKIRQNPGFPSSNHWRDETGWTVQGCCPAADRRAKPEYFRCRALSNRLKPHGSSAVRRQYRSGAPVP